MRYVTHHILQITPPDPFRRSCTASYPQICQLYLYDSRIRRRLNMYTTKHMIYIFMWVLQKYKCSYLRCGSILGVSRLVLAYIFLMKLKSENCQNKPPIKTRLHLYIYQCTCCMCVFVNKCACKRHIDNKNNTDYKFYHL